MNELAMKLGRPPQPGVSSATRRVRRRIRTFARRRRFRALRASTTHRRRRRRRHRSTRAPPLTSSSLRTARPGRTARRASTLFPSRPGDPLAVPASSSFPSASTAAISVNQSYYASRDTARYHSPSVIHEPDAFLAFRLSSLSPLPFALVSAASPASHERASSHPIASHRIASHRITHESHVLPELVRVAPRRLEQGPKHGWVILVLRHRVGRSSFARHRRSSLARETHDERERDGPNAPSFALPRARSPRSLAPARASLRRPGAHLHRRARHPPDLVVAPPVGPSCPRGRSPRSTVSPITTHR